MSTGFYTWSQTAASNATADTSINWQEGQAPSSVNDSARAMMAVTAKYRDDTSGNLLTAGTSTAYTLTTNQVFDTAAHMDGQEISFRVHATNGASPTLNPDGLGNVPLTTDGTNAVPTGSLIAGSIYTVVYSLSGLVFRLKDFYVKPHETPIGAMIDYFGTSVPNANWVFPIGQAISRTTYATLFALMGTTYGVGDGSTTFNVPDVTGRVTAMKEASATRLTSSYFVGDSTALGAVGGGESKTLLTANLPAYTPAGSVATTVNHTGSGAVLIDSGLVNGATGSSTNGTLATTLSAVSTFTGTAQGGTSTPIRTVQPTIICNKILRVL